MRYVIVGVISFILTWYLLSINYVRAAPTPAEMRVHAYQQEAARGIPHGLLVSVCDWENRSDEWRNVVSHAGAVGVCQILPGTARHHGVKDELPSRTLSWGSRGDDVKELQTELKARGFYEQGRVDGVFGPVTFDAVVLFQRSVGLTTDGIVGVRTWDSLRRASGTAARGSVEAQLRDPLRNIEIAAIILKDLLDEFHDPMIALAAYNGGPGSWPVLYMVGVRTRWRGGDL